MTVVSKKTNAELAGATSYRWIITAILFVLVTVAFLDRLNISVLIADDTFVTEMGIKGDTVKMGLFMTLFLISYGASSMFLAPLGDVFGPRKILIWATILWGLAMIMGSLAGSYIVIALSRLVLGVGEGLHWPMQSKLTSNWFPQSELGRANSIWLVGAKVGPVVAVPLFSWIITHYTWNVTFDVLAALSFIMLVLLWVFVHDTPEQSRFVNKAECDHIRAGTTQKEQSKEEKKAALKRATKMLLSNKDYWMLTLVYICQCCIFWGMLTWLPSYLKIARGFSWAALGGYTALTWIGAAAMTVIAGIISDKIGRRAPFLMVGMLGAAGGIFISFILQDNFAAAMAIICGVALTGCSMSAIWSLVPRIVEKEAVGTGSGILNGSGMIAASLVPTMVGFAIQQTGSFNGGMAIIMGCAIVGALSGFGLTLKKY